MSLQEASTELRHAALDALRVRTAEEKMGAVQRLAQAGLPVDAEARIAEPQDLPGRPARPLLVSPARLAQRSMATETGRAALLHALAHIEFNAVNLALDAVWRFSGLPVAYYEDWVRVAGEEASHFKLLERRLSTLGVGYGDFDAHDGLWELALKTRADALARMALVPRTMEARGLDASPQVRAKFAGAGDEASAAIIDVILRDEIGHVAVGNRWFRFLCERAGQDPLDAYPRLAQQFGAPQLRPPFNFEARRAAGFTETELLVLAASKQRANF
ncbi:MAG TPA: ferritin-like domain-containing protein [Burkholderiaceae bacterium]|nr:ferritin-like domain-containing protein [Burkholderiaceae bacterium]